MRFRPLDRGAGGRWPSDRTRAPVSMYSYSAVKCLVPPPVIHVPHRSEAILARAMMIGRGWNKCAFEQSRHVWVSSWILPLVSRILFHPVILIVLPLDDHSCWVITRAAQLYKQIDLVIRDDGVGYVIEERRIWAHYALNPKLFLFVFKGVAYLCSSVYSRLIQK